MRYLIGAVFAVLTVALLLIEIKIGILVFTDSWTWILVGLGFLPATIVSALITSVAFAAASEY